MGSGQTTVADGHALVNEADGLLVDELDGGIGAGLGYMLASNSTLSPRKFPTS